MRVAVVMRMAPCSDHHGNHVNRQQKSQSYRPVDQDHIAGTQSRWSFNGRGMRKAVCTFTCDVVVATSEATSATNMVAKS
jgi:hypothetical protein